MRLLVSAAAFGLVATLALAAPNVAFAQSAQDAARAYEACLIGNFVLEFVADAGDAGPAFDSAADLCSDLRETVPEDYPGGEAESYGPGLVEENAIHLIDSFLVERLRQ